MRINGARLIVESLKKEKVDTLFCYIGGKVIPVFDELFKHGDGIRLVKPIHEQGGTHAADGYARSTGKVGVVLVTSGPGATNTITGIATAYMDSVPMVIISGQVSTAQIGTDAFQESDVVGITLPITKANFLVTSIENLAITIKRAFHIARTGRPGTVLIDIPSDVQMEEIEFDYPKNLNMESYRPKVKGHPKQIKAALNLLINSKKPLIISGGGVISSNAAEDLAEFSFKYNIPVVSTLMGHGIVPKKEELYYKGIGMHGTLYGNYAVQNADLILAMGTRFSDRILGDTKTFASGAKIVHVDVDPAEIGKNKDIHVPIVGQLDSVIREFINSDVKMDSHENWIKELESYKKENPLTYETKSKSIKPQFLIDIASQVFPEDTILASDVGQNQMWVAQFFRFRAPRTNLTSGGLGTMGFALPAAIGAAIGNPQKTVLMVAGDGGFQMNIQELATIVKYKLKVKMLVMDNQNLGMVRQWQELLFGKRYAETIMDQNPDIVKISQVYGIHSVKLENKDDVLKVMTELAQHDGSMLVHAIVDSEENVLPMVPPGKSLNDVVTKIGVD